MDAGFQREGQYDSLGFQIFYRIFGKNGNPHAVLDHSLSGFQIIGSRDDI